MSKRHLTRRIAEASPSGKMKKHVKTVKEATKPVRNKIIVGVDYGTTYSGPTFP